MPRETDSWPVTSIQVVVDPEIVLPDYEDRFRLRSRDSSIFYDCGVISVIIVIFAAFWHVSDFSASSFTTAEAHGFKIFSVVSSSPAFVATTRDVVMVSGLPISLIYGHPMSVSTNTPTSITLISISQRPTPAIGMKTALHEATITPSHYLEASTYFFFKQTCAFAAHAVELVRDFNAKVEISESIKAKAVQWLEGAGQRA
ncbi:hypothetical protein N0V94_002150 [Neodidymelliopsis sp. IMI 364377]|nr:hypothetical protein N0V94_002150 [Neodidymelliopsis sp. IMI 364377]